MQNRPIIRDITESLRFFGRRFSVFISRSRRLLIAATLLHVALAVGLFWTGRAQVAPGLIDGDGIMGSFAFDSYEYQSGAGHLLEVFRQDGVQAWATASAPVHVKVLSIEFALFGPLFGDSPLSAEPFNLLCYVAIVGFTLALGREVGGERAGLIAAVVVALWPTLLLHTLQLLKDPLFIAGALTLVLCVTTWVTREYGARVAVATGAFTTIVISLLLLIRSSFAIVIFALVLLGLVLLIVRQIVERRPLYWNMVASILILSVGALLLLLSHTMHGGQKFKHYPSDQSGQPKAVEGTGMKVPTVTSYLPRLHLEDVSLTYIGRFHLAANRMALRVGSVRYRFTAVYSKAGSNIDPDIRFRDIEGLLLYIPRAFEIGCCAPFPEMWASAGSRVGSAGKLLSGAETLVMYVFELLALVAVFRPPRRLAALLLFSVSAFGVMLLGLVVPNVGALYRFRYTFWVLLIVLGAKGGEAVIALSVRHLRKRRRVQAEC